MNAFPSKCSPLSLSQPRPGLLLTAAAWIAGRDPATLVQPTDKITTVRIALGQIAAFLWLLGGWTVCLAIGLGSSPAVAIPGAAIVAAGIILLDHAMLSRHSRDEGIQLLAESGLRGGVLGVGSNLWAKAAGLVLRTAIACAGAYSVATCIELKLYGPDIEQVLRATATAHNAALRAEVTEAYDRQVEAATTRQHQLNLVLEAARAALASKQSQLRKQAEAVETERQFLQDRRDHLAVELSEIQDKAAAEIGGIAGHDTSGLVGRGPRAEAFLTISKNKSEELTRVEHEIAAVAPPPPRTDDELKAVAQADEALSRAQAETTKLGVQRLGAITAALERDPRYVRPCYGLVCRLTALDDVLTSSPAAAVFATAIKAILALVELAGVLASVLSAPLAASAREVASIHSEVAEIITNLVADSAEYQASRSRAATRQAEAAEKAATAKARTAAATAYANSLDDLANAAEAA